MSNEIIAADYIIKRIGELGIDKQFVVYGAANGDLIDAFTRVNNTQYVAVMHEQAGGFAAEGYAKIKKLPGVCIVTSGPGGMNLVTPIGNFYYDSIPGLFITGQINSNFLRPDPSIRQVGFQETDIVSIVKPITKYAKLITSANDIPYELDKALYLSQEGRQGPVLLDIPINIQKQKIDLDTVRFFSKSEYSTVFDYKYVDKKIENLIKDLQKSKRPTFLVGGGIHSSNAIHEIVELAKYLQIPFFPTWNALDIITSDLEIYGGRVGTYGGEGRNFGIQNSDLLVAIGSRISGRITGGNLTTFARAAKKYVVDIDETLLQKNLQQVPFDENIFCDAKIFITRLLKKLKQNNYKNSHGKWLNVVINWRNKYDPVKSSFHETNGAYIHPYSFIRKLSNIMKSNDILVGDCGGNIVTVGHAFKSKFGQRMITNNGNSPMGFSFAASMGAALAEIDTKRNVVCIIGDGGMNMNIQELQTLINYKIIFKTFILNNHIYGITKAFQKTNFGGREEACGPKGYNPPNFLKIAKAYGIKTHPIDHTSSIENEIKYVLDSDECILCDVNCHEFHTYEPRIFGWETPIEDMYPYLPRKEFRENLFIDPVEGWENPVMPNVY